MLTLMLRHVGVNANLTSSLSSQISLTSTNLVSSGVIWTCTVAEGFSSHRTNCKMMSRRLANLFHALDENFIKQLCNAMQQKIFKRLFHYQVLFKFSCHCTGLNHATLYAFISDLEYAFNVLRYQRKDYLTQGTQRKKRIRRRCKQFNLAKFT
uniref:Uncharacterized protein n=1 Tax=Glossina pallidipes TaxID=7398 RepID=A0A1A9ZGF3_GLOPL